MMDTNSLFVIWMIVVVFIQFMFSGILVAGLLKALRRNEYLTSLLAVGHAHGGTGTDAARAQVATVKELRKQADKVAAGVTDKPLVKHTRPGLRLKVGTP